MKIVKFFVPALLHMKAEMGKLRHPVKPQFLIEDDDEYQEALEINYHNDFIDSYLERIDGFLEGTDQSDSWGDAELGAWVRDVADFLSENYRITISKR